MGYTVTSQAPASKVYKTSKGAKTSRSPLPRTLDPLDLKRSTEGDYAGTFFKFQHSLLSPFMREKQERENKLYERTKNHTGRLFRDHEDLCR